MCPAADCSARKDCMLPGRGGMRLDYREFKEELARLVREELGENVRVHFEMLPKNNGVRWREWYFPRPVPRHRR